MSEAFAALSPSLFSHKAWSKKARSGHHQGVKKLALVHCVLAARRSVEHTARQLGAALQIEVRFTGWLFWKVLDVIARAFGFGTSTRRLPRMVKLDEAGTPDTLLRRTPASGGCCCTFGSMAPAAERLWESQTGIIGPAPGPRKTLHFGS